MHGCWPTGYVNGSVDDIALVTKGYSALKCDFMYFSFRGRSLLSIICSHAEVNNPPCIRGSPSSERWPVGGLLFPSAYHSNMGRFMSISPPPEEPYPPILHRQPLFLFFGGDKF